MNDEQQQDYIINAPTAELNYLEFKYKYKNWTQDDEMDHLSDTFSDIAMAEGSKSSQYSSYLNPHLHQEKKKALWRWKKRIKSAEEFLSESIYLELQIATY